MRVERAALTLAAALLAATLFSPSWPGHGKRAEHVVVLDITQSMNVPDVAYQGRPLPRLAAAKAMLADAIVELPCGSKIGLGLFTEYRALVILAPVEVCANRAELLASLAQIDGRMAWTGNSEVAKGLNSSLRAARELPGTPSVVFVTDGQEAPLVNPKYRPGFADFVVAHEARGLILGVGGDVPAPIPKTDPSGRPLGFWRADEVSQVDTHSLGRDGSVSGEAMADDGVAAPPLPGATPGHEHLSSLREAYLQLLAGESGLRYQRLRDARSLARTLMDDTLARPRDVRIDLRPWLGGAALVALLVGLGAPGFAARKHRRAAIASSRRS